MVADADVINVNSPAESADPPSETPTAAEAAGPAPERPAAQQRAWSMPKAPVNRRQVDELGRAAVKASVRTASAVAKAVAGLGRHAARGIAQTWRAIESVPATLRLLGVLAVLMLLGIVGSIAAAGTLGMICSVVVVPVCAVALGAVGHRWFSRSPAAPATVESDLSRSVVYVDRKLTLALNSLGSERHQQAVIALFQAKTAVELALGTEQDEADRDDAPVPVDAYRLRPRIQAGPGAKTAMSESNSLAAS
ncbi:hypothetical protein [Mycolicibacterium frederiksbergense]|uniref:hypothetical protein n=1 Tax=Mycolicibacterium frederiksbergense TaxID=117567 RepID=UPI00265BFC99|nr:hypothetical protein [Mycolicibacterium frederiksbergense]MDO0975183.1 hypothetical protein [Mycolicibacterium frederiksbergense]